MPRVLRGAHSEGGAERGGLADFSRHYSFAPCGRSFHARRPVARLDRIMHCGRLKLVDCGVHESAAARKASDHLPIWAELGLGWEYMGRRVPAPAGTQFGRCENFPTAELGSVDKFGMSGSG